ncbi:MAG: hypothetical protein JNL38_07630, partial [Myxococcales bacterium]|nr:hypothetical protein [Myxococcales bacterium]
FAAPSLALLVALPLVALGCAADEDRSDDADSSESDVKKKIKPKGGNGAFDLQKPAWSTEGFAGDHRFGGSFVAPGGRVERVPGSYGLTLGGQALAVGGRAATQSRDGYAIGAGVILQQKASGLRVRFAEPVTLGRAYVTLSGRANGIGDGYLDPDGSWRSRADGANMFVLPGALRVRSTADGVDRALTIAEGELAEVVLPTARVNVVGDDIDPAYPTVNGSCTAPFVRVGAPNADQTFSVRRADGAFDPTTYVVPQGAAAPATLHTYGIVTVLPTVAGSTHTFTLNRLEVDDVEVNTADGGTAIVRGSFTIQRKVGAELTTLGCTFPTHSGVDLPDGAYVVTTTAASASGPVRHVEEISFP